MKLDPVAFSISSYTGISLGVLESPAGYTWTRELNEVSKLSLTGPFQDLTEQIIPWVHWITCWYGQDLQWTGPIQDVRWDFTSMVIEARDVSTFMWRTRTPRTQSWSTLNIAPIANDMWLDMLRLHNVSADPIVLPALSTSSRYNVSVTADQRMMNADMSELAKLGLKWTVVQGRPILGNQPESIAAELSEFDMSSGAMIGRSGVRTANDVRVQGKNYAHTERIELGGLHLQSIVSIDDVFGVNNIQRAAAEYTERTAVIRDQLIVPANATLTPDAPVEFNMLVPGIRIMVSALGLRSVLRLDQVSVSGGPSSLDVSVNMSSIDLPTQLKNAGGVITP